MSLTPVQESGLRTRLPEIFARGPSAPRTLFRAEWGAYALFFAAVAAFQSVDGAFRSGFGGHPDEAAHYVTGLMVRDYVASLDWRDPLGFAENYYVHYPKVSLGHWPPVFYMLQAAWTLVFSPERVSVLLLMAFLTTLLAGTLYRVLRTELSAGVALGAALLFLALPLTRAFSGMLMADIPVALFSLWAALCFGRYVDTGRWQSAAAFGVFASAAIMTKGSALALALVPPVALLLSRRLSLLARPATWLPALIVFVLCAPWSWLTYRLTKNGLMAEGLDLEYMIPAVGFYSWTLFDVFGVVLLVLAGIGLSTRVVQPALSSGAAGKWTAMAALAVSVLLFHCVLPIYLERRYLLPAVPALLMFAAAGFAWCASRLPVPGLSTAGRMLAAAAVVLVLFVIGTTRAGEKSCYGFAEVAEWLRSRPDLQRSVVLVASDASGEGMAISEIAMRERRPGHVVLRGSKVLSRMGWLGEDYEALYKSPEELTRFLEGIPVGIVLIDQSIPAASQRPHHELLRTTLRADAQRWELFGTYAAKSQTRAEPGVVEVYRLVGHEDRPVGSIHVDLSGMLGRSIRAARTDD
jgi:hypothetical protein